MEKRDIMGNFQKKKTLYTSDGQKSNIYDYNNVKKNTMKINRERDILRFNFYIDSL